MLEASQKLKAKYPEYGEISTKTGGMTEFRLKKLPSKYAAPKPSKTEKVKSIKNRTRKNKPIE
jgi:hypothetical protein